MNDTVAQDAPTTTTSKGLTKVPGSSWAMLFLIVFAAIAAPLNQFKCPGIAGQLMEYFNLDSSTFGWTMSVFTIAGIILAFPASAIMSRFGTKRCIGVSLIITLVGSLIGTFSNNIPLFLISRIIEGVSMGLVSVAAPAAISRLFPRHSRGLALGIFSPWVPIGNVVMLNLANPLTNLFGGWQAVWWFASIYTVIFIVLWFILYREPAHPILDPDESAEGALAEQSDDSTASGSSSGKRKYAILNLSMWLVALGFLIFNVTQQGSLNTFYPTYLNEVHGFTEQWGAFITSVVTMLCIPGAILGGWVADRIRTRKWTIFIGYIAFAIAGIWLFNWTGEWQMWLAVFICGLLGPFVTTNVFASAAEIMGANHVNLGTAIIAFMQNIGSFIGGIALGYIQVGLGWGMGSYVLFYPLLIIAIICLFCARKLR